MIISKQNRRFKMKKLLIAISIVSIFALGTLAFAQGMGGWGGGHMTGRGHMGGYGMMGSGYGGGHMGTGNAGHMGGRTSPGYENYQTDQKFLDETVDLRKDLHNKRFEYAEASRNPDMTVGALRQLEKEIYELESKINNKATRTSRGYSSN
jgi:hypothetical protein